MRGFITSAILLALVASTAAMGADTIRQLITEKARLAKTSLTGADAHPIIRAHGSGVTDGQETLALNFIDQAYQTYGGDQYGNSVYIQQKIEDALSGRWNVEIFGNDPSWGRSTYIKNDQWILLFGYGPNSWDYILWVPDC